MIFILAKKFRALQKILKNIDIPSNKEILLSAKNKNARDDILRNINHLWKKSIQTLWMSSGNLSKGI